MRESDTCFQSDNLFQEGFKEDFEEDFEEGECEISRLFSHRLLTADYLLYSCYACERNERCKLKAQISTHNGSLSGGTSIAW